jgi:diguanylate cyclase (GGDEF)-like protein
VLTDLFIYRDGAERGRLLDMNRRLRVVDRRTAALFAVALAVATPSTGWPVWLPVLAGLLVWWLQRARLDRYRRPELALLIAFAAAELGIAAGIALAHGPRIYLLPALILPVLQVTSMVPRRVALMVTLGCAALMAAVALLSAPGTVSGEPFALLFPVVGLMCAAFACTLASDLDIDTRRQAIVDPLTGMPNRAALESRVAELEYQSSVNGRQVALIIADIDHFKLTNDEHGHEFGDRVLAEMAEAFRESLEPGASAYRLGGEEFVVLLADADVTAAQELAERLRSAASRHRVGGIAATMSFGVTATEPGETFSFPRLFERADSALYVAKDAGRDQVSIGRADRAAIPRPDQTSSPERRAFAQFRGKDAATTPANTETTTPVPAPGASRWDQWNARQHRETGSLLIRDDIQRQHLQELNRYLRAHSYVPFALGFACAFGASFIYGWPLVVMPLLGSIVYIVCEFGADRVRRPEFLLGIGWLALLLALAAAALLLSRPAFFALTMVSVFSTAAAAEHPPLSVGIGVSFVTAGLVIVSFSMSSQTVLDYPGVLSVQIALLLAVALLGGVIGRSTIDHRNATIVDPLTGMFNRSALDARAAELGHRASVYLEPVAVIVGDLDRFKAINDEYGHAIGDAVLKEVAYRIRKSLRAFESAYRIGGEEFVILLDEVAADVAIAIAERLHAAVADEPIAGIDVTMSVGVAFSSAGEAFDYPAVFSRADAALYRAKREGRNRVLTEFETGTDPRQTVTSRPRGLLSR